MESYSEYLDRQEKLWGKYEEPEELTPCVNLEICGTCIQCFYYDMKQCDEIKNIKPTGAIKILDYELRKTK